jgi:hypothetical protein
MAKKPPIEDVLDILLGQIDLDLGLENPLLAPFIGDGTISGEAISPALDRYDLRGTRASEVKRGRGLSSLIAELRHMKRAKTPGAERRVVRKGVIDDYSEIFRGRQEYMPPGRVTKDPEIRAWMESLGFDPDAGHKGIEPNKLRKFSGSTGRVQNLDTRKELKKAFKKLAKARGIAPLMVVGLLASLFMGED